MFCLWAAYEKSITSLKKSCGIYRPTEKEASTTSFKWSPLQLADKPVAFASLPDGETSISSSNELKRWDQSLCCSGPDACGEGMKNQENTEDSGWQEAT